MAGTWELYLVSNIKTYVWGCKFDHFQVIKIKSFQNIDFYQLFLYSILYLNFRLIKKLQHTVFLELLNAWNFHEQNFRGKKFSPDASKDENFLTTDYGTHFPSRQAEPLIKLIQLF